MPGDIALLAGVQFEANSATVVDVAHGVDVVTELSHMGYVHTEPVSVVLMDSDMLTFDVDPVHQSLRFHVLHYRIGGCDDAAALGHIQVLVNLISLLLIHGFSTSAAIALIACELLYQDLNVSHAAAAWKLRHANRGHACKHAQRAQVKIDTDAIDVSQKALAATMHVFYSAALWFKNHQKPASGVAS